MRRTRSFKRIGRQTRSARQKHTSRSFSVASIVEEGQDAICYIDFSKHRFYSNGHLRQLCPTLTTQTFVSLEALTHYLLRSFVRHGADSTQITHLIHELVECASVESPSMTSRRLQFDDRTLQLIFNFTRTPRGVFIMWRDQTEIVQFEERKNAFLAELSHDFRTPLTAIQGYTELLMARHETSKKSYHMLEQVKQETERLNRLVDNFLDYQKLSYSAEQLTVTTFSLRPLLEDITKSYQSMSPSHNVTYTAPDVIVQADETKLRQMLHNLIGNAIKYSPDGGTVHTEVENRAGTITLSVSDTGIGIPEDALPYVFDEYYRVESSAHQSIKGTGLGLRICKRIAEAHGWGIHAHSVYGEGTTFTIELHDRQMSPTIHTSE
ncbi:sensor histidine kinase [Exiguobacterium qingdaonense]|uniref:sensor histidine kinase n=1 Tax=Exiguobacterium qingdaonense TaxID=2751251 RepID=UPI001BEBDA03|nr:HAMP domain-containing sensor histidine kinase [Exiguobacterium qingdaonense]